jgi:hypothetical protein
MKRAVVLGAAITFLAACGAKEERACCAIEPKARCESQLFGAGVTADEMRALRVPDAICPGPMLSEARLREIAGKWPADCRSSLLDPLHAIESGRCKRTDVAEFAPMPEIPGDTPETPTCIAGLKARGLKDNEMWVMLHPSAGICPSMDVDEARIREILAKDWEAAGCKAHTLAEMLHALESGACGGDAG